MPEFQFQRLFPLASDETVYRCISKDHVSSSQMAGKTVLQIDSQALTLLAKQALQDVSHLYRAEHLASLRNMVLDPESSDNDRTVASEMLHNAVIAAEREFPMCQDTGTAIVMGYKGQQVLTGGNDEASLSRGIFQAYADNSWRYSQNAPLTMYDEQNTGSNLPAQIELYATEGDAYTFLFLAKGGGSANKTYLFQETKALLQPEVLVDFLTSKMQNLGTAACPPYHIAFVIGGTSPEMTLKTVKLASAKYLDTLPSCGQAGGYAFRDIALEAQLLERSRSFGLGAQFGGRHFCHDVRVIRLPRHGGSCPIGLGVSCSADRNIKAKITQTGLFVEQLVENPADYMPEIPPPTTEAIAVNLDQPMASLRNQLSQYPVGTRLHLSGPIIVARDIAHARLQEQLEQKGELPHYVKNHILFYAGPAKTPPGYACGALGPTTSERMDPYVPAFQAVGASLIMLGKGNRSSRVTKACQQYGGFYLGCIGGTAARLAKECIRALEVLDYSDLGMEAIYKIKVQNFPAFILIDDKGNDFFASKTG